MTPYATFAYFFLVLLILVPMIIAALRGQVGGRWIVAATLVMLVLQYYPKLQINKHTHWPELVALIVFSAFQWFLLRQALAGRVPGGSRIAIPLALLPLIVAKTLPDLIPGCHFGFAGISYVTFRALDVLWAVTDGVLAEVGFLDFAVFLFFFPTISAGPIDRFRRFKTEWRQTRTRTRFLEDLDQSVPFIMRGLLYKFVIATIIERHFLETARVATGFTGGAQYAYLYSAYLFFDFAGYSAFAMGVSRWFGISSPANFSLPWSARNIREFWNRWHMSLSFWFRDHVYSRFLIAAVKGKWFRQRETASNAAYFVSFGLMGLWHGLTWYYILYGIYHATLLAVFDTFSRWKKKHPAAFSGRLWQGAAHLLTIHAIVFGLWLFSGHAWEARTESLKRHEFVPPTPSPGQAPASR